MGLQSSETRTLLEGLAYLRKAQAVALDADLRVLEGSPVSALEAGLTQARYLDALITKVQALALEAQAQETEAQEAQEGSTSGA